MQLESSLAARAPKSGTKAAAASSLSISHAWSAARAASCSSMISLHLTLATMTCAHQFCKQIGPIALFQIVSASTNGAEVVQCWFAYQEFGSPGFLRTHEDLEALMALCPQLFTLLMISEMPRREALPYEQGG